MIDSSPFINENYTFVKTDPILHARSMFKLLDEALKVDDDLKEVKENDERYLVIDNNKLRARNKLLFEENKRLRDLTKTGIRK